MQMKAKKERVKYSIDLDKELHTQYRILSIEKDKSMRTLVVEALTLHAIKLKEEDEKCNKSDCPITVDHEHNQKR